MEIPNLPFNNSNYLPFRATNWNGVPAVYGVLNAQRQMIYVGETDDLKRRMAEHIADSSHAMHRYGPAYVLAEVISAGEQARRLRERQLIAEYRPPANG